MIFAEKVLPSSVCIVNGHVLSFPFALPKTLESWGSKTQVEPVHGVVRKEDESLAQWAGFMYFWQQHV
jgi:hypothetical protein